MLLKFMPLLLLLVASSLVAGQEPKESTHLEVSSHEDALIVARENGRRIYLIFKSEECVWCKRQSEEMLKPDSTEAMDGLVVCVVDIGDRKDLRARYGVRAVPAHRLLTSEGKVFRSASGYLNSSGLKRFLAP